MFKRIIGAATVAAILAFLVAQYESCSSLSLSRFGICRLQAWRQSSSYTMYKMNNDLLWMAPFISSGGYASEALSYVQSLDKTGAIPRLRIIQHGDSVDHGYWSGLPHSTKQLLLRLSRQNIQLNNSVVVCHSEPGAWFPPLFQTVPCPPTGYDEPLYVIGRTMFETDRLNPEHVRRCNKMDEIWVPSDFNMNTFAKSGVDSQKLVKVPQAVDVEFFNPKKYKPLDLTVGVQVVFDERQSLPSNNAFIFLSIFKWETRKGWDILIRAYLEEFSAKDNVILYIVTSAYHEQVEHRRSILNLRAEMSIERPLAGWPALYIQQQHIPQVDLPGLYKAASVFVLPSRGEGWGRPHVEAMAMGLPIIATNWSGSTEFMTEFNSYGLKIDGLSQIHEGPFKGHMWAESSVSELRRLMRHVFTHREEAKQKGLRARKDMVEKYSPQVIARIVLKRLLQIQHEVQSS